MLLIAGGRLFYGRRGWARVMVAILALSSLVGASLVVWLHAGGFPSALRVPLCVFCLVMSVVFARLAGKCELEVDLESGNYNLVDGFPLMEAKRTGRLADDFRNIVVKNSELGLSVYLRWKSIDGRDFYIGQMTESQLARLESQLGIPVRDLRLARN